MNGNSQKSRAFLIIFSYEAEFLPLLKYHFPNASEGRQHQSNEGQHHQVRIQLLRETMTIYHIHFDWHKPKKEPVADQKEAAIMNTNRKAHHDVLQFTANILEEENYG